MSTKSMLVNVPGFFGEYKNVVFAKVDFGRFVANTSAAKVWSTGAITKVGYFLNNISNVLRIVLLLRFGGVYFDSDVISAKPVPDNEQVSASSIC